MSASTSSQSNVASKRPEGWYNFCPHCSLRYWVRSADMSKPRMTRYTGEDCQTKHECPPDTVKKHRKVDPTVGAIYAKESEVPMSDPNGEPVAEIDEIPEADELADVAEIEPVAAIHSSPLPAAGRKRWTQEDDEYLMSHKPDINNTKQIGEHLGRSWASTYQRWLKLKGE